MFKNVLFSVAVVAVPLVCFGETDFPEDTNTITSLTKEQANELVLVKKFLDNSDFLMLNGLKEIDPKVAIELTTFQGTHISLDGLEAIDLTTIDCLMVFKGHISLRGISFDDDYWCAASLGNGLYREIYLSAPYLHPMSAVGFLHYERLPKGKGYRVGRPINMALDTIDKGTAKILAESKRKWILDIKQPVDRYALAILKSNPQITVFSQNKVL